MKKWPWQQFLHSFAGKIKIDYMAHQDADGYVKSETHQSITTIEFYHPRSNSLPAKMLKDLAHAIHVAGAEFNTRVIVLRSAGHRAFCGGAAFEELANISTEAEGLRFFSGFAD